MKKLSIFDDKKIVPLSLQQRAVLWEKIQTQKEHKDSLGCDPFHRRNIEVEKKPVPSLATILVNKSMTATPLVDFKEIEVPKGHVPPFIHFIWLGSAFTSTKHRANIRDWQKLNPSFATQLWVDHHSFNDSEVKQWCSEAKINLVSVSGVFLGSMPLEPHYRYELDRRNFGGASDILRVIILNCFGGVYADIDIYCIKSLTDKVCYAPKGYRINNSVRLINGSIKEDKFNGDLIVAQPQLPLFKKWLSVIEEQYKLPYAKLLHGVRSSSFDEILFYDPENFSQITYAEMRLETGVHLAGPQLGVILGLNKKRPLLSDLDQEEYERFVRPEDQIDPDFFEIKMDGNWLKEENYTPIQNAAENFKTALTVLLHELECEPRVLWLDKDSFHHESTLDLLQALIDFYPEKLTEITFIHCSFSKKNGEDLFKLLSEQSQSSGVMPQLQFNFKAYFSFIIRTADVGLTQLFKKQIEKHEWKCVLKEVTATVNYQKITSAGFLQLKDAKHLIMLLVEEECFDFEDIDDRGLRPLEELCVNRQFELVAELIKFGCCKKQPQQEMFLILLNKPFKYPGEQKKVMSVVNALQEQKFNLKDFSATHWQKTLKTVRSINNPFILELLFRQGALMGQDDLQLLCNAYCYAFKNYIAYIQDETKPEGVFTLTQIAELYDHCHSVLCEFVKRKVVLIEIAQDLELQNLFTHWKGDQSTALLGSSPLFPSIKLLT